MAYCTVCMKQYQDSTNVLPNGYCSQKCIDRALWNYKDQRIAELESELAHKNEVIEILEKQRAEWVERANEAVKAKGG